MAFGALQLCVRAEQREVIRSLLRVIEIPQRPTVGRMTTLAFLAEAALVHVVVRMAIDARARRPAERECCVALRAAHDPMQPQQREIGQIVVEYDVGAPRLLTVARFAAALEFPPCGSSLLWQPAQSLASF